MRSEAEAIGRLVATAPRAGCFFDFDGTLAPIQVDPDSVWPTPGVVDALTALTGLLGRVAVVSARPVGFLRSRLERVPGLVLHGHYGLQTMTADGVERTDPAAVPWVPVLADLARRAEDELPRGARVERQPLSVTLHYRVAPDLRAAVEAWAAAAVARTGVRAQRGRMVIELRPAVDRDKGTVITEETADLATAWYAGDDLSDLRAFAALTDREAAGGGFAGVRAAVVNDETGGEVAEAADFVIGPPEAVPPLLDRVVRALGRR
ncbi:MAG: trehalose-phosphatase [Chloroflexi bacterium]|nr:MAG: trehalose-phosphatase [Chloroflexota bacterium]